jgi:hypothetical protein
MADRLIQKSPLLKQCGVAYRQLGEQMLPFVAHLARRNGDGLDHPYRPYLGAIERVSAGLCFGMNPGEIGADRLARLYVCFETFELRMLRVSARVAEKHGPSQQAFPP